MPSLGIWHKRQKAVTAQITSLCWIAFILLASEVLLWGLSFGLRSIGESFYSLILGMVIVFVLSLICDAIGNDFECFYTSNFKTKVDFINNHLGVGFTVPILLLIGEKILPSKEIGLIIANFALTNFIFWPAIFFMTLASTCTYDKFEFQISQCTRNVTKHLHRAARDPSKRPPTPYPDELSDAETTVGVENPPNSRAASLGSEATLTPESITPTPKWVSYLSTYYPNLVSLGLLFACGAPVAAVTGDQRALDGFTLWFAWISSIRLQQGLRQSSLMADWPNTKRVFVTLLNAVVMTSLTMMLYAYLKSLALPSLGLEKILTAFSRGDNLSTLWTAGATKTPVKDNSSSFFGAGDLALAFLECGIVVWGFKLYECRRQLFSAGGMITVVISIAAAAANVFLPVLIGRGLGLQPREALSFCARSTTLALSKPAMEAVDGNIGVNAALVVGNGVVGQLMLPLVIPWLKAKIQRPTLSPKKAVSGRFGSASTAASGSTIKPVVEESRMDDAITVAIGATSGINSAAMGVAYLYAAGDRAAPYAALAMAISGVMTVIFSTIGPFEAALMSISSL